MPAAFNKGATLIALKELRAAGRTFHPGDHFAWRRYALAERTVAQLIDQRTVAELSQEAFDIAMVRRNPDNGAVPNGFTRDGLKAVGIELPETEEDSEAAEAALAFENYDHVDMRGDFIVAMRQSGIAKTFDVFDAQHQRLNTARIRGERQLDSFLFSLEADRARIAPAAEHLHEGLADHPDDVRGPGNDGQSEPEASQPDPVEGAAGEDALDAVEAVADLGEGDYE